MIAGGHHRLAHQESQFGTGPVRTSEVDGGIRLFQAEVERSKARRQVDCDPRILPQKAGKARGQPSGAESWQDRQVKGPTLRVGAEAQGRAGNAPERLPDLAGVGLSG